jgi:hypothetical protein
MHPTLMIMFMDAQRAGIERRTRLGRPNANRTRTRHSRGERR